MIKNKKNRGKRLAALLAFILIFSAAGWVWSLWARIYSIQATVDEPQKEQQKENNNEIKPDDGILNILILGIDQRSKETSRADSIIVMSINNNTDEVSLLSIPRDARVDIPGYGYDKINHAMAYEGVSLMTSTVEALLDITIDQYVYTNLAGFENLVSALGGVTLDIPKKIWVGTSDGKTIAINAGEQRLNGMQALAYVRFRHDSEGDFGRMRRQQQFLKSIADQVLQINSILIMPKLLEEVAANVRTDMKVTELLSFAIKARSLNFDEVVMLQMQGKSKTIAGVSYVILDEEFLQQAVSQYIRWQETEG